MLEGIGAESWSERLAAVAFFALLALPVSLGLSLAVRALLLAWRPRTLVKELRDADGAAPVLAGWLGVLWTAALVLGAVVYGGTRVLADETTFEPIVVSFAEPVIAVVTVLMLVVVSRPLALLYARSATRLDGWWRRAGRATLLTPRRIVIGAIGPQLVLGGVAWFAVVRPAIGPLDTSVIAIPAIAVAILYIAHARHARLGRARWLVGGLGIAALASALVVRHAAPSLVLALWGDRPVAGFAIDLVYDLDAVRDDVSLADFQPVERRGVPHPDIILVTIDTVRTERTPAYGGGARMPVLRELANSGSVFTWAFAAGNVTRRSIPALAIGLYPDRIRGRVVGWALRVDPRYVVLAERMRAGGYETAGFMCCQGFWGRDVHTGLERGLDHLVIEKNGPKLAAAASAWLAERDARPTNQPLFLWMHIIDPHTWLSHGQPRTVEDRDRVYERTLATSDAMLGQLLAPLRDRQPDRAPIVIVTADHGEALGDHGQESHATDLYNSQLRVPLVMSGPGIRKQQIVETTSLVDVGCTILELAGFEPPTTLDGRSLADVVTGRRASSPDTGRAYAMMIKDRSNPGGLDAVIVGRWKLIASQHGELELYNFYTDPGELENLADREPQKVDELTRLLEARRAEAAHSPFER